MLHHLCRNLFVKLVSGMADACIGKAVTTSPADHGLSPNKEVGCCLYNNNKPLLWFKRKVAKVHNPKLKEK